MTYFRAFLTGSKDPAKSGQGLREKAQKPALPRDQNKKGPPKRTFIW
jgi:hypothetical protein